MLNMTRIIGGVAGSLKLGSPAKVTRPTSDRVRESIFSRLDARELVEGAKVLDLYAGTGALGLEALSRGAVETTLVEKDVKASAICSANAKLISTATGTPCAVKNQSVQTFLSATDGKFDLVFIDPPYEITGDEVSKNLLALLPHLTDEAVVVLERSSRDVPVDLPEGLALDDAKNYGDTTVYWISLS